MFKNKNGMYYIEETQKIIKYLINNFSTIKWKKWKTIDINLCLYTYETHIKDYMHYPGNNVYVIIKGYPNQQRKKGHYVMIDVGFNNASIQLYTKDNGENSELFKLEELLGESETYLKAKRRK